MIIDSKKHQSTDTAESGYVLVMAMVFLLLLTMFGMWAMQTSTSELNVAGSAQQSEQQFNIAEGGANSEAVKVGFVLEPRYTIFNPSIFNQLLIPPTDADMGQGDFDPGADTATTRAAIAAQAANYSGELVPIATWPWENLLLNYNNLPTNANEFDYRYLVTYLFPDTPPMGYDANTQAAYKFRIESAPARIPAIVELGGTKIGPR